MSENKSEEPKPPDEEPTPEQEAASVADTDTEAKPAEAEATASEEPEPDPAGGDDPEPRERRLGQWARLDTIVMAVVVLNLLLTAGIAFLPSGSAQPDEEPVGRRTKGGKEGKRTPLVIRNQLWERAQKEAAAGEIDTAIDTLDELLKDGSLTPVVRRSIYLQLSYYCGLAGRSAESRRWLRLSKSDLEVGLVPEELWRLAEEATAADQWVEARRYYARFLLQQGQMPERMRSKVPVAYLRLADGYRDEARKGAQAR